jgi:glycosyltransferase involved in cell wall biosynthesis
MPGRDIVFVHQNMPGQFRHLVRAIAGMPKHRVFFITCREGVKMAGIRVAHYTRPAFKQRSSEGYARPFEAAVAYGQAVAKVALDMKKNGVKPALVVVHPGWGEGLFLRDVWPDAKILSYAEYYYQREGGDLGFDPMFSATQGNYFSARAMDTNLLVAHEQADVLISPTHWQKSRHPQFLQDKTRVIFDGIDTQLARPDPEARMTLPDGRELTRADEVITYVARNLEPHRGYHVLMKALPKLLAARPDATVLIVGGDEVSYSPVPRDGHATWRAKYADEVKLGKHGARVYHLGKLPYSRYLEMLRVSSAHIYLTYPFVLSWSCLEAMASGCAVVASDTGPLHEVAVDGENALLVPFFDTDRLVAAVGQVLDDRDLAAKLGAAARATVVGRYEVRDCLNAQLALVGEMIGQI